MPNEQKDAEFKWIKPATPTRQVYTNYVHISWSLFDVRILLGQIVPSEPGITQGFSVEEQGAVTLAWPAVKGMRDQLIALVKSYEEANGEIKPLKIPSAPQPPESQ